MSATKPDRNMYVLVTGGRRFTGRHSVDEVLTFLHLFYGDRLRVMHGAAEGLDTLVAEICAEKGIVCKGFPAEWGRLGKAAGKVRNDHMVSLLVKWRAAGHSVQCLAWPGGTGTAHCAAAAERAEIDVDYMPGTSVKDGPAL